MNEEIVLYLDISIRLIIIKKFYYVHKDREQKNIDRIISKQRLERAALDERCSLHQG